MYNLFFVNLRLTGSFYIENIIKSSLSLLKINKKTSEWHIFE